MYCLIVMVVLWCVVFCESQPHDLGREQIHRGTPFLKVIKTSDHEVGTETISSTKPTVLVSNNNCNPNSKNKKLQHHPDAEPPPSGFKCEKLLKLELQLKNVKNKKVPALRPMVYLKERSKRATIKHAALPSSSTNELDQKQNIQMLLNDPGFLANLEKVFPHETVRINADRYERTTSALHNNGPSRKNSSGLDDRLIPLSMFHEIYDGNAPKKTSEDEKKSTATSLTNEVSFASYGATPDELFRGTDKQERTILEIFGTPPPPPLSVINVHLKDESEGTTGTLPTANKSQTSRSENNKNSAMPLKTNIYVYIVYSLIFIFLLT